MNANQMIISDISGYCGLGESGAQDDGYYEQIEYPEKLRYIEAMASSLILDISEYDAEKILDFLEKDKNFTAQNERYQAWMDL